MTAEVTVSTVITVLQRHRDQVAHQLRSVEREDDPRCDLTEERRQGLIDHLSQRRAVWDEAIAVLERHFERTDHHEEPYEGAAVARRRERA